MQRTIFSKLGNDFSSVSANETNIAMIDNYLANFPKTEIGSYLSNVPSFFYRAWIRSCINGHLLQLKRLRKLIRKHAHREKLLDARETSYLWLGHAEKLFTVEQQMHAHVHESTQNRYILEAKDLEMGDVVLSYKTLYYLKHSPLSRFIRYTTHSSITHAMVVSHEHGMPPKILMSDDTTSGVGEIDPVPDVGEIYVILKPKENPNLSKVFDEIRRYKEIAHRMPHSKRLRHEYRFARNKCIVACVVGIIYVVGSIIARRPVTLKNPMAYTSGVFCSELIDYIFAKSDLKLTARSRYRATTGPVEMLYSPRLTFKGVLGDPEVIRLTQYEIEKELGVVHNFHNETESGIPIESLKQEETQL